MLSDEIDRLEGRLDALQMVVLNSIITLGEHDTDFVPRLLEQLPAAGRPHPVSPIKTPEEKIRQCEAAFAAIRWEIERIRDEFANEKTGE